MRTVRTARDVVTVLQLVATAACGMFAATGFLTLALAMGGGSVGRDDLLRDLTLQGGGLSALCVAPALVALWLRARRPVASGTIAAIGGRRPSVRAGRRSTARRPRRSSPGPGCC